MKKQTIKLHLIGFIISFISFSADCTEAVGSFLKANQYLSEAKRLLVAHGWKPVKTWQGSHKDEYGNYYATEITTQDVYDHGYTEVVWCSSTDSAGCTFNYKKDNECLKLHTEGEFNDKSNENHFEPYVTTWQQKCPLAKSPLD